MIAKSSELESRRLELDEKKADREFEFRSKELALRELEFKKSRWTSPLFLGIAAAAIAGASNAYVSWLNGVNQTTIESTRNSSQIALERERAETNWILEATKSSDLTNVALKLQFLIEVGLISDPNRRAALVAYLSSKKPTGPPIIEKYASGWLGGGNNQTDQCAIGRTVVSQKYPEKSVLLKSSSEQSKKDIFGRVEYQYFCEFDVR